MLDGCWGRFPNYSKDIKHESVLYWGLLNMNKYKVWLLLVLCNLFWAGNYVFGKYVVAEMSPLWITFTRWFLASFILVAVAYVLEKPSWSAVMKEWKTLTAMAILGITIYTLLLYEALNYTSSTNAALVSALNPAVMAIFAVIFLKERITKLQTLGLGFSLIGVIIILTGGNLGHIFQVDYNKGDLLMLAAILVWTIYSIIGKRLKSVPPITATAASSVIAVILMTPFAIYQGIDIAALSPMAWTGIIYITIFPSVCSFIFWNIGVKELGANKTAIFLNLIPVFTASISLVLGNKITTAQILGGVLVFAGVYVTTAMKGKKLV
jgi:drug/metabolite transporter (DMT)-like permease